jgi:hypothetical protein
LIEASAFLDGRNPIPQHYGRRMAHGSWLMAHGSWLMAHGSWLMAHGSWLACPESSRPAIMLEAILGKEISPMKTKKEKHETGVE